MVSTTEQTEIQAVQRLRSYSRLAPVALLVAFPAVLFYTILIRTALDIPFYDDYGGLVFMNKLTQLNGFIAKAAFLLTTQFNEYKLVFAEALTWLQFDLLGRVDFKVMSAISNAFVLLLALLLWKMFLPAHKDLGTRLALFIPASWLLFQLQYFEILNWGGAGLQHLPSTLFAFAAIYLLFRKTRKAFCGALACYVLAIASSGNGLLLLPIGLLALVPSRRYARMSAWLLTSAGCIAVYFYHYNMMSSKSSPDHSIISALLRMQPAFVIGFIGGSASVPFPAAGFVLGTALCVFFIWMAFRGYVRKNPAVSCCVLFLLLTAIGVAGIRSGHGLDASTTSRYTIFSALFLIFAWFAIVEEFLQHNRVPLLHNGAYLGAVMASMFFCLFMDTLDLTVINIWNSKLIEGMAEFEHPNPPDSTKGPVIPLWKGDLDRESFNPQARAALIESIKLGVYRPPKL